MSKSNINGADRKSNVAKTNPFAMDAPSKFVQLPALPLLLPEMGEYLDKKQKATVQEPTSSADHLYNLYRRTKEKINEFDESSKKSHNMKMRDVVVKSMGYMPRVATVIRDGAQKMVDSTTLVIGDVVELSAGSQAVADMRIVKASADAQVFYYPNHLGHTPYPPTKRTDKSAPSGVTVVDSENMLFSDTYVVRGSCVAVVVATGDHTIPARADAWCLGMSIGGDVWSDPKKSPQQLTKQSSSKSNVEDKVKFTSLPVVEKFLNTVDVHTISLEAILSRLDVDTSFGLSVSEHERRFQEYGANKRTRIGTVADGGGGGGKKCIVM